MSEGAALLPIPCPNGRTNFVWASNQTDKNCLMCGLPLAEHLGYLPFPVAPSGSVP